MSPSILIVEDELMLRQSVVRGLSKTGEYEVFGAGTLAEARARIDRHSPDMVISDLNLPDGIGVELIGELGKRGLHPPMVFVSAYVRAYAAQIPERADIQVLQKPIDLSELRRIVRLTLGNPTPGPHSPFGVVDYLQLACMGRHSVCIEATMGEEPVGHVEILEGVLWRAHDSKGEGEQAFTRMVRLRSATVTCRSLPAPGDRNVELPWEQLLLDAARREDEERAVTSEPDEPGLLDGLDSDLPPAAAQPASEPAPDPAPNPIDALLEEGLDATLTRDYGRALRFFEQVLELDPDHVIARTNVDRLASFAEEPATSEEES